MTKMIDPRALPEQLPRMTMMRLLSAFTADCGCASSCRAMTHQANHGLCGYHETLSREINRRKDHPPTLRVLRMTAEISGECDSCHKGFGTVLQVTVGRCQYKICSTCQLELEAILKEATKRK